MRNAALSSMTLRKHELGPEELAAGGVRPGKQHCACRRSEEGLVARSVPWHPREQVRAGIDDDAEVGNARVAEVDLAGG